MSDLLSGEITSLPGESTSPPGEITSPLPVKCVLRFEPAWLLVAALTVFAVAPLTYPGFFQAHSGFLPAFNAMHLADAPHWGRLADPVRGDGKLPYLLAWPFWKLSGSGLLAVKWGYGMAFVLAALGAYTWTRRWLGPRGGVLAAVVYTYLPWHLGSVYVRGAYAEAWLWALWPFALWGVDRLAGRRPLPLLAAAIAGLAALVASFSTQTGLSALFALLLVAYGLAVTAKRRELALRLVGSMALMLVVLWFASRAIPAAVIPFRDHFLYPFQLLSAAWDFGVSVPGWADGLSFQLGLAATGLSVVAIALWLSHRAPNTEQSPPDLARVFWFSIFALILLILLALPPSAFFWSVTGLERYLTYPWQLLTLAGLPLAFLAGSVVRLPGGKQLTELPAWAGLLALIVLASYPYLAPRFAQVDPGPEPVAMFQPVGADAPQILILEHQVVPPTEITPTLTLTLTWQAVEPVAGDYTVFVHVLTPEGVKAVQRDARPCDGECPTDTWLPGEIIVDRHQLSLAPDAPAGPYRLGVGLYLLDSGERAAVVGRDDQMVLFHVP